MKKKLSQNKITRREKEIISFLSEGLNSNEIARLLFISSETVKTHRKNIIEKTGAKNTANLIRIVFEKKLFDFSEINIQLKTA